MRLLARLLLIPLFAATAAAAEPGSPEAVVGALHDALARGDVPAAGALHLPGAGAARLGRLAAALREGGWDFAPGAARIEGACAAVLVQGKADRAGAPDRFPLYLASEGGAWRLLPDPTRARLAGHEADLAVLAAWAAAETRPAAVAADGDGLGTWVLGAATLAGRALRPGQGVPAQGLIAVSANRPARLVLNRLDGSSVSFSPGAQALLREEPAGDGTDLVIELMEGIVQVDVASRGPYAHVRVRSGASDVLVTGTVFLVQRVSRAADYVAQVEGAVRVRRRNPDGSLSGDEIVLTAHQGVGAGSDGFTPVDQLTGRPQLTPERLAAGGLRSQGLGGAGGWGSDAVAVMAPAVAASAVASAAPRAAGDDAVAASIPAVAVAAVGGTPASAGIGGSPAAPVGESSLGVVNAGLGASSGQTQGTVGTSAVTTTPVGATAVRTPLADPPGFPQ